MKRKVLIVAYWYPNDAAPVHGIFVEEQARALATVHDVAVVVPGLAAWRNVGRSNSPDRSTQQIRHGIPVVYEFALPAIPHGPEAAVYSAFTRAADKGFAKLEPIWGTPDIIHAHVVLPSGWAAVGLANKFGVPLVLTEHSGPFSMHFGSKVSRDFVRKTLQKCDRIISVGPSLKQQIDDFEPGLEIDVFGNLVQTDFFVPAARERTPGSPFRFLFVGHLVESKGVNYLLEAAALLVRNGADNFEIIIGGDGLERDHLVGLAEELGIQNRCRFLGALSRGQVRESIQQSDVFILPSLHETFGIVLGEAMACGKPVISTRCGGPEFVVNDDVGRLVEPANPAQLAEVMAKFLKGDLRLDEKTVRASVESRFGPSAFVKGMSQIYDEVLELKTQPVVM
jgi:glycosyltransferase involved in cell wall biosynthesis